MDTLIQLCHCSHHKSTHHEGRGACLGMRCDDCTHYRDASKPDTLHKNLERPANHPFFCRCYVCKQVTPSWP